VHARIDELAAEHEARVDEHVQRLERVARILGERVGRGDATVADATRRLEVPVETLDPDIAVPVALVPYAIAQEIIGAAFADGLKAGRRGH